MISLNVITIRKPNVHAHIHVPHTHKPLEFALNKTGKESKKAYQKHIKKSQQNTKEDSKRKKRQTKEL